MDFTLTPNVHVRRDTQGNVRHLRHLQQPYSENNAGLIRPTPLALASKYLKDVSPIYAFNSDWLTSINEPIDREARPTNEGTRVRLSKLKNIAGTIVVGYQQTHLGLPIWRSGFRVQIREDKTEATSSASSIHLSINLHDPIGNGPDFDVDEQFTNSGLKDGLKIAKNRKGPEITRIRWLIYRYEASNRFDAESEHQHDSAFHQSPPTLPLSSVPDSILNGRHYIVQEIMFTLEVPSWGRINWRALREPRTGTILYLRALVAGAFGNVFTKDPISRTGNSALTPDAPATDLDVQTDVVTLQRLTSPPAGDPQSLDGEHVTLTDTESPTVAPPTATLPTGNFSASAPTDDFAAVNAYYHCDWFYQYIEDLGFDLNTYFDGTAFPVTVDHRGKNSAVNASAEGNISGDGMDRFLFGLAQSGENVGIASDRRVVLHEFGHAINYDHVEDANLDISHSVGDSLAAILCDPDSIAPDRFMTFPWLTTADPGIDRRHDRDVASGWAWGGTEDNGGYDSEQILSTTHFRAYRSTGGDDANQANREFAARYMAYLMLKATASFTPATNPDDPDEWATALMEADQDTVLFEGHPGGAFHKVIRWAFEKQGLYQPVGAPTPVTSEGSPPEVDVFIDDGRNGEYEFRQNFWNSQDIWVRNSPDGGLTHETPIVGVPNYLYARVQNRGSQTAQNVVVSAYNCEPATGLVWPDDWQPMTTASISAADIIAGGNVVIGPFEWTPQVVGHECVLVSVSADGDISNADTISDPIPHSRLVPFDNNIAQRNLAPVPGAGGSLALLDALSNRVFEVRNPYPFPVRVDLEPELPKFLQELGWGIRFTSAGGTHFSLGPRGRKRATFTLIQGREFTKQDVQNASDTEIVIVTRANGLTVGGMSYYLDPTLIRPPMESPKPGDNQDCKHHAEHLLDCLCLPDKQVDKVQITKITIEIDLREKC